MTIQEQATLMKRDAPKLAALPLEIRNRALSLISQSLCEQANSVFAANKEDLERARKESVSPQIQKRLVFDEKKLSDVQNGIADLVCLPDPVGHKLLQRELDEGLVLTRVSCPIGVIGVIFEARPDALVQISSLCIKSGNAAILKGGKETARTNRVLFDLIYKAGLEAGLPKHFLFLAESHSEIDELLLCDRQVDLIIPRGSNHFVRYIMDHTSIPVMGHADGVCHIYVEEDCDQSLALNVIRDAKTQYPVACNAVETVLIRRSAAPSFLPLFVEEMQKAGVRIHATDEVFSVLSKPEQDMKPCAPDAALSAPVPPAALLYPLPKAASDGDPFHHEYGELDLTVALVEDVTQAVEFINRHGSHHTDAILTENDEIADYFLRMVDSAGVYRNCSTRFADGFRYGFGAEVGISTSKLHARGPVGLDGLVTYKYELCGSGQIVGDYASKKASFHFKDLIR